MSVGLVRRTVSLRIYPDAIATNMVTHLSVLRCCADTAANMKLDYSL
jgi:hypothetical protein